jgi:hypothetical protein
VLNDVASSGFANSCFGESEEEGTSIVEEFYTEDQNEGVTSDDPPAPTATRTKPTLKEKFEWKATGLSGRKNYPPPGACIAFRDAAGDDCDRGHLAAAWTKDVALVYSTMTASCSHFCGSFFRLHQEGARTVLPTNF